MLNKQNINTMKTFATLFTLIFSFSFSFAQEYTVSTPDSTYSISTIQELDSLNITTIEIGEMFSISSENEEYNVYIDDMEYFTDFGETFRSKKELLEAIKLFFEERR